MHHQLVVNFYPDGRTEISTYRVDDLPAEPVRDGPSPDPADANAHATTSATGQPVTFWGGLANAPAPQPQHYARPIFRFSGLFRGVREELAAGLVARGVDPEEAEQFVGGVGDGRLIRWLVEHGPDIAKLILLLLPLFAKPSPVTS